MVKLTRELVRIASRGGADSYSPVLDHMSAWMDKHGLACRRLTGSNGATAALTCEVTGALPGPCYVLDACLDTAPFGDEAAWTFPPAPGEITGGWMHGRGSSDSKAGAAIFAHIAARFDACTERMRGTLVLLFDVEEHTGSFGGARAYFEEPAVHERVDGVMIGYPGLDHVVTGGRGVLRARMEVHGIAGHSGGRKATSSAVAKAAALIRELGDVELPGPVGPEFPLPARLTVTAISGGEGYSTVPDLCTLNVDVRLTPALDDAAAVRLLRSAAANVDDAWPGTPPTRTEITTRWPAYALPNGDPLRSALLAATRAAGLDIAAKVAGPSNIGNYLAGLGVPATAGFGVEHAGLHGTDERIRLDTIPLVQAVYHQALLTLMRSA